jgi:hypothetical protein
MIPLLLGRGSRKGQSMLLALVLWIGQTLSYVIYYPMLSTYFISPIIIAVGITHFLIGAVYTYMLMRAPRYERSSLRTSHDEQLARPATAAGRC